MEARPFWSVYTVLFTPGQVAPGVKVGDGRKESVLAPDEVVVVGEGFMLKERSKSFRRAELRQIKIHS